MAQKALATPGFWVGDIWKRDCDPHRKLLLLMQARQLFVRERLYSFASAACAFRGAAALGVSQFIHEYGYFAIALGSFLEGEAVLLAGSLAAYHGHLELAVVLPLAAFASFLGDLPYFFGGRRYGERMLRRYPALVGRKQRVEELLERHCVLLVLTMRYLYGLRIAGLIVLGMSRVSTWRFLLLDFIGAIIWASSVCAAGYGVGRLVHTLFRGVDDGERMTILLALLACSYLFVMLVRRRRAVPAGS